MSSNFKNYTIFILYCVALAIIIMLFVIVKEDSNPMVNRYTIIFPFLFASVFLLTISTLYKLCSKVKKIRIEKIANILSIILSAIGVFLAIFNILKF